MMDIVNYIYVYCTDFVINVANLTNLSYYEVNFIFFVILYPLALFGSILLYIIQKRRLKNQQNCL
jgi:hypothetical protein